MFVNGKALTDERTEARLMAAILGEPGVLARCEAVETDDFADLRFKNALCAIRELQLTDSPVDVVTVADAIAMLDLKQDKHVADTVSLVFLALLVCQQRAYRDDYLVDLDIAWLQKLKARRAAL